MKPEVAAAMAEAATLGANAFNAEEAQYVMLAPQLMAALSAIGAGTSAVMAEHGGGSGEMVHVSLGGITVNVDAETAADKDSLRSSLSQAGDDLGAIVIEKIEDYFSERERRAYK